MCRTKGYFPPIFALLLAKNKMIQKITTSKGYTLQLTEKIFSFSSYGQKRNVEINPEADLMGNFPFLSDKSCHTQTGTKALTKQEGPNFLWGCW